MNDKVCCIGAGYIGGTTMVVAAQYDGLREFRVVDCDERRIDAWNSESLPIYEPNLAAIVRNVRGRNLTFSTDIKKAIHDCDIIFVGVCTPTKFYGEGSGEKTDMSYWEEAARDILIYSGDREKIVVEKSTLPVGTADMLNRILNGGKETEQFHIVSNPEFLAEGTAINDLLNPSRVLIGGDRRWAQRIAEIYSMWVPKDKIVFSNVYSAELTKLVSNFMLAQRVTDANAVAEICERTGADVKEVMRCVGLDGRIGDKFLTAGAGFGGSCFRKDIMSLTYIARSLGLEEVADYVSSVVTMNEAHETRIVTRLMSEMNGTLKGKKVAVLGYSFKANTGDTRDTPSEPVVQGLLNEEAKVYLFDPKAVAPYWSACKDFHQVETMTEAVSEADAVVVMVDWEEFKFDPAVIFDDVVNDGCVVYDVRNCMKSHKGTKTMRVIATGER